MTSNDVLSMYEAIAGLTTKMATAAQAGDMATVATLEARCATEASAVESGVPALSGTERARKIALLKMIMANDRAIRDVTEPWINQVHDTMAAH
jgi:flagellar protein FliT